MNIRDLARIANVTPGTVSKVLNNYPDISEATRQHVLSVIAEHKYDPKASRRSGRGGVRMGLVLESVQNRIYSNLEDILSINFHNSGYVICSFHDNYYSQDKREKFGELIAYMKQERLSGLIYLGGYFGCLEEGELAALPCPTIFVNTVLPTPTGPPVCSSVRVSNFETAYAQMKLLIEKGHRDICTVITSEIDNSVYGLRAEGYRAALRQEHLEHDLDFILESEYGIDRAHDRLLALLKAHPEITAVCCASDIVVPGILRAIHDAGRAPGKDVAVISFDGLTNLEYTIPTVTTFAQPVQEMAQFIDKLMQGLLTRQTTHQNVTFSPSLMRRESF